MNEINLELPNEINILGIPYKIIYVDNPSEVDIFKRESLWGQIDYWTRTIRIYKKDQPIQDVWHTIIHEIFHGIEEHLKLKCFSEQKGHDELDIMALAFTDTLFRNGIIK